MASYGAGPGYAAPSAAPYGAPSADAYYQPSKPSTALPTNLGTAATSKPQGPLTSEPTSAWQAWLDYYETEGAKVRFLIVWMTLNAYVFFATYDKYRKREDAYAVLKEGVCIARGCGALLKLNSPLLLVPVSRNFLLYLRETFVNDIFPMDKNIVFHKKCAFLVVLAGTAHTIAHLFNFTKLSSVGPDVLEAVTNRAFEEPVSMDQWLLNTIPGTTGIGIVLVMLFMYSSAHESVRRPQFEVFWFTHHLFIPFYFFQLIHGAGGYLEPPSFWKWFIVPGSLYAIERALRIVKGNQDTVLVDAIAHPSRVLEIRFQKATFNYKSGMYLFLCCPYIYKHEWHPFTITSAPSDPYVSVHIRMVGDWTQSVGHLLLKSEHRESILQTSRIDGMPILKVDGPFGAASDQVYNYKTVMLVGAGIGVTPFASILKDIRHRIKTQATCPLTRVYFFWISRDKGAFEWFSALIADLEQENVNNFLSVNCYLTGALKVDDIRSVVYEDGAEGDAITGLESQTSFGRPNWPSIFQYVVDTHDKETVGIFFCGPKVLSKQLARLARRHTTADGTKMVYSKENF